MKILITLFISGLLAIAVSVCAIAYRESHKPPIDKEILIYRNNGVIQTVKPNPGYESLCNNCTIMMTTKIWYKQEILKAWYDDFEKMDSVKIKHRYKQADSIYRAVLKLNN